MNESGLRYPLELGAPELALARAVARRMVRDDDAANDVAQEAMLLAHRFGGAFRGDAHPHTWLYRVTVSAAITWLRRRARELGRRADADTDTAVDTVDPAASPEELVAAREVAARLAAGLDGLAPLYRDVLALRARDHSDAEIAAALGLSRAVVKVRAHRGRKLLRATLDAVAA